MVIYAIGLTTALLAISLAGRRLTKKLNWSAKPNGWFRRSLAILLILVGLAVITGFDKKVQTWFLIHVPLNSTKLEEKLLPSSESANQSKSGDNKAMFNIDKPYSAPEIAGIANWINSDPMTIESLKGKVVLIDFWTYSCINCIRTQPYLNKWYDRYEKDGFVIIGVHAPEFAFEKLPDNVRGAVSEADIKYPVALDNDFTTWKAYDNQYWPAKYLIDKDGQVRYTHFGEGEYDETEAVIQDLLKETGKSINAEIDEYSDKASVQRGQTPEIYLGYERGENFVNADQFKHDEPVTYALTDNLDEHVWSLGGNWQIGDKQSFSSGDSSVLRVNFSAREVYLVMDGPRDKPVSLLLNGRQVTATDNGGKDVDGNGQVHLNGARLYKLIALPQFTKSQTLDITVPNGTTINAFTFGG